MTLLRKLGNVGNAYRRLSQALRVFQRNHSFRTNHDFDKVIRSKAAPKTEAKELDLQDVSSIVKRSISLSAIHRNWDKSKKGATKKITKKLLGTKTSAVDHDYKKIQDILLAQATTTPFREVSGPHDVKPCGNRKSGGGCKDNVVNVTVQKAEAHSTNEGSMSQSVINANPKPDSNFVQGDIDSKSEYVNTSTWYDSDKNNKSERLPPVIHIFPKTKEHNTNQMSKNVEDISSTETTIVSGWTSNDARSGQQGSGGGAPGNYGKQEKKTSQNSSVTQSNKGKQVEEANPFDSLPIMGVTLIPPMGSKKDPPLPKIDCQIQIPKEDKCDSASKKDEKKSAGSCQGPSPDTTPKCGGGAQKSSEKAVNCSKCSTGGQKGNESGKDCQKPKIDCSKYNQASSSKNDSPTGGSKCGTPPKPQSSDCCDSGKGGPGAAKKETPAYKKIDCSKFQTASKSKETKQRKITATGCGGVKLESGQKTIDCRAIKGEKDKKSSGAKKLSTDCGSAGKKGGDTCSKPPAKDNKACTPVKCEECPCEPPSSSSSGGSQLCSDKKGGGQSCKPASTTTILKSKDCKPVLCTKKVEKPRKPKPPKIDPAKRIRMEEIPKIFNCCLRITGREQVQIENCPMPEARGDMVVVKMKSLGLCASDVFMYTQGTQKVGANDISLGHEGAGVVVEVGPGCRNLRKGDGVVIEPGVPCGHCKFCRSGRYNVCTRMRFTGLFSSYIAHPARYCHKIQKTTRLQKAALAHPLSLALHACRKGHVSVGSKVLILGACPRGLSTVIAARSMGADKVVIIDTLEKNLKVASELCADMAITADNSLTGCQLAEKAVAEMKYRPNVVIDCCGCSKTVQMAVIAVEKGGRCVLSGCQTENADFPILPALAKEVSYTSSFRLANMFPRAISLIETGRAEVEKMITHRVEFCDAQDAFHCAAKEEESSAIKVMIKWPEPDEDDKK